MKLTRITQGGLEDYEEHLIGENDNVRSASRMNRLIIEAAQAAGFAVDLPDDLRECDIPEIVDMTQRILEHVAKAKQGVSGE
jgi:hypothetical protein